MANMVKIARGRIRGRTIELDQDLDFAEGQVVEVQVKLSSPSNAWGEGLRRCAGALANEWTEEDDRILEEIYRDRKRGH
jgi:hypothetical protein